jgi:LSU ribosomal protein L12P
VKVVKEITGLGLKEAKDLVDASPNQLRRKYLKRKQNK